MKDHMQSRKRTIAHRRCAHMVCVSETRCAAEWFIKKPESLVAAQYFKPVS
jgi:hypothetical protein